MPAVGVDVWSAAARSVSSPHRTPSPVAVNTNKDDQKSHCEHKSWLPVGANGVADRGPLFKVTA